MDISSINSDLIRGNVTTIILGSLWNSDRYGYDILKEIEARSDGQYKLKQPTLYNQLKRLEKQGLISSYDGDPDDTGGGQRKYYTLTAEGRQFLQKEKREYEYSRTILDKLVSAQTFDFSAPAPFDTAELRPYAKTENPDAKPKIVYKDKVVEVEKIVEIEKKVFLDSEGKQITEEEAERLAADAKARKEQELIEAEKKKEELNKPSMSIFDLFAKLDSSSEYSKTQVHEPVAGTEIKSTETVDALQQKSDNKVIITNMEASTPAPALQDKPAQAALNTSENGVFANNNYSEKASELKPINDSDKFINAEISTARKSENGFGTNASEQAAVAAVKSKRDSAFEYENKEVNYRDFFSSISSAQKETQPSETKRVVSASNEDDLKTRLYAEGFKIRPFDRGNTSEYYTFNFLHSNRIGRDCYLIVLALYILEIAIMWVSLANVFSFKYFLPILICGSVLLLLPALRYLINPTKRIRASFNFKLSMLIRGMLFIELTVVCILISFFGLGTSVNDINGILASIILPMVLLTNFPVSTLVYELLYRSKRYHIA